MKTKLIFALIAVIFSMQVKAGTFVEYKITIDPTSKPGSMKMFYQDGNTRTEMFWPSPQMPNGEIRMTNIVMSSDIHKIYNLNEKDKTYTVSSSSEKTPLPKEQEYEVTVIGKETVNGYASVHVKIKRKNSATEQEMWTSKKVNNYESYKSIESQYTSFGMYKALADKGAEGFPVRIMTNERGHHFQLDLVKAETLTNDNSLFSLKGYTLSTSPSGINSGLMQQYQNMTPEEREKMIEKMKEQYGKPKN